MRRFRHRFTSWHSVRVTKLTLSLVLAAITVGLIAPDRASAATTYTATQTIPVPPASNYAGSGGGDGWGIALSSTAVYNVFHHDNVLQVACHLQSDASACWSPETITDTTGNNFASSGHPGLWLDQSTGKLYVFATRTSDSTGGVICIDTTQAATNTDPFCGFTALSAPGQSPLSGWSAISAPALVGTKWYAFNYAPGQGQSGSENELLCFDLVAFAACASEPFPVNLGAGAVDSTSLPSPAVAAVGNQVIVPLDSNGTNELGCFDGATQAACAGSWPVQLGAAYAGSYGAPFPMTATAGTITGLCLPTGTDPCFTLAGASAATPSGMSVVIGASDPWNGGGVVLGPRVYVPNGNANDVQCFDYSTNASCTNFPRGFSNLGYLYTVNPDPQRPTCLWVNSNDGSSQIQNFDAYTAGACGAGPIRVLASGLVVPTPNRVPNSYVSLQVTAPARSTYSTGSITFEDGDGNVIPGTSAAALDPTGTASLSGLSLNTATGLPEFLISLTGASGTPGSVTVVLTWTGQSDPSCQPGSSQCSPAPGATCSPLVNHGGTTMGSTKNYLIFWGNPNSWPSGYQGLMAQFFNDVGGSGLYQNLRQYGVGGKTSLAAAVDDTDNFSQDCTDTGVPTSSNCVSQGQIEEQIRKAIDANNWPTGSSNMFWLFLPPGEGTCWNFFALSLGCFATSNSFCAYHDYTTHYHLFGSKIIYAVMPYYGSSSTCVDNPGSPNGSAAFDSELSGVSHEFMEAVTDPLGDAWYGSGGQSDEIGDKCNWDTNNSGLDIGRANQYLNGHYYQIQGEWSNAASPNPDDSERQCVYTGPVPWATADVVPASGPTGSSVTIDVESGTPGQSLTAVFQTSPHPLVLTPLCTIYVAFDGTGSCSANIPSLAVPGALGTHEIDLIVAGGSARTTKTTTHFNITQ